LRFSFIHAADLHLDSPLTGLGQAPHAEALKDATLAAFDAVVARALACDAAFVVLAGDLYDGPEHGLRAQLRFQAGLERLSERGVEVFIAHGNHDPKGGRWDLIRRWPPGVHVFPPGLPATREVTRGGAVLARVHGVSYAERHTQDNLARRFPRGAPDALDVAVLHCNVGGDPNHGDYAPCTLDDLLVSGLDYWALGHVHRHRVLARGPTWVVYPGCTQGRGFKPGEVGPKGAVEVVVDGGAVVDVLPFSTDRVRFLEVEVDIAPLADAGDLQRALDAAARRLAAANPDVTLALRGRLTGRGGLHARLRPVSARQELLAELSRDADAWVWTALDDQTAPLLDLGRLRQRDDLLAAILETSDRWGASGLPASLREELLRPGLDLPEARLSALLSEATLDALSELDPSE
jgi:exonuclease SbcD